MPLHDWNNRPGWEGVHHLWISELLRWVKPRLPSDYRAYIGSAPLLAIGAPADAVRPDVGVRSWIEGQVDRSGSGVLDSAEPVEPDFEVAVASIDPGAALFVEHQGRLVAAVELISPRNKDRPLAREAYLARYLGYLLEAVHLLLVDVHNRPIGFSFADRIATELNLEPSPLPAPCAVSYRVGEPAPTGGRLLALWRRSLSPNAPLPALPLPLSIDFSVSVDLEQTYMKAAHDAYLD